MHVRFTLLSLWIATAEIFFGKVKGTYAGGRAESCMHHVITHTCGGAHAFETYCTCVKLYCICFTTEVIHKYAAYFCF
jgi:hypothetical protein